MSVIRSFRCVDLYCTPEDTGLKLDTTSFVICIFHLETQILRPLYSIDYNI